MTRPSSNPTPTNTPRAQERRRASRRAGTFGRVAFALGLAAGLAAGWLVLPELLYSSQDQPMEFNHLLHVEEAEMDCSECHDFRADGSFAGIPPVELCADCHSEVMGDSPVEEYLVAEYIEPEKEIPWIVYSRQPENVYFSHAAHVTLAEIECQRCHGDKGETESLPAAEFNKLSTYSRDIWGPRIAGGGPNPWDSMKMSDCADCHAERGVRDHCLMCHK